MGQATSRSTSPHTSPSRPPFPQQPPSSAPSSASASASASTSAPSSSQSSQRDGVDSVNAATKRSRRSSLRRTVRGFLRPRTQSESLSSPSSSSGAVPSLRKRWRSSRRFSKAPSSLPDLTEALHEGDRHPAAAVDAHVLPSDEQPAQIASSASVPLPSLLSTASCSVAARPESTNLLAHPDADALSADDRSSTHGHPADSVLAAQEQPSSPSVVAAITDGGKPDGSSPSQQHPAGHPHDRVQEIEREITDFLLDRPRQDSLFVEGSSQDGQMSDAGEPELEPPESTSTPSPLPDADALGAADPSLQAPRHFPPPGTLVVVQGVVNTSDNPVSAPAPSSSSARPSSAAIPHSHLSAAPPQPSVPLRRSSSVPRTSAQPEERQSARSRLSAFIPRPSSMLRRRSSTSEPFHHHQSSRSSSDLSSDVLDSGASSDSLADVSPDPSSASAAEQRPGEDTDPRPRPLSPGSIDVLGTLLSVAAAATAASLFSPSLGFQAASDPNAPLATGGPAIPRPMSPTPTAGLGGGPGFSVVPDFGADPSAPTAAAPQPPQPQPQPQREGRERIRSVWESFRERLGLNRSGTAQAGAAGGPSAGSDDAANMRPGEIMLAEMARALNVGLGLTGDGAGAEGSQADGVRAADPAASAAPSQQQQRPPPPEDSFERFLLDLQADLRIALSEGGVGGSEPAQTPQDTNAGAATAATDDGTSAEPTGDGRPRTPSRSENGDDELPPPLQELSDSEDGDEDSADEEEEEGEEVYDEMEPEDADDRTSVRIPTPMPSSPSRDAPHRSGSADPPSTRSAPRQDGHGRGEEAAAEAEAEAEAERRPPGIHLWRLYRFRPIHATQIAGHAASTTSPPTAAAGAAPSSASPAPAAFAVPSPVPSADSQSDPSSSARPQSSPAAAQTSPADTASTTDGADPSSSAPAAPDPNANMVVPVIVVGLQSVEMGQVHGHGPAQPPPQPHQPHQHQHQHQHQHLHEHDGPEHDDWLDEPAHHPHRPAQGGDATPRGRSWQSRAATALRNLRPGRRNASRGQQTGEGAGSRTFLIYVIGGYYPPNHHMVTGPDNLDSYEALWELAELLGQVKPQVATREDIEKSDLQTVKYSALEEYEREGRVASNCVERCLICLDDYQPEDDLRLMHCRHAFHKDCVDKWLQVGRNNCPACRTKGVSTADELVP